MKRIVLCADDYGQAPAVSAAILSLIQRYRLTAVSCILNTAFWSQHAKWLMPFCSQVDVGLHLNLTSGKPLSKKYRACYGEFFFPLPVLFRRAFFRHLNQEVIADECLAQIERFVETLGFLPHFIDGHHHVHQFPIIRNAFISVYQKKLVDARAYVRLVDEKINHIDKNNFKKLLIRATGTKALKILLNQNRIPYNESFAGIYTFAKSANYRQFFKAFLADINDGGLIMCHPGMLSKTEDSIAHSRYEEYCYLASEDFVKDCGTYETTLIRYNAPPYTQDTGGFR